MQAGALLCGWNAELDITTAIGQPQLRAEIDACHVLIAMVDSTPASDVADLVPMLRSMGENHSELGLGIVVLGRTFLALVEEEGFFNGFDEIWSFRERPTKAKPDEVRLISDRRLNNEVPTEMDDWLLGSDLVIGLGDGVGLNYVTPHPRLAELWTT